MLRCNLKKDVKAVHLDVQVDVPANELLVILGPSGCGKSTLLNLIAGFRSPDEGQITLGETLFYHRDGSAGARKTIDLPIYKRQVGYIQQESCLFPHMSVKENLLYGVKKKARKLVEEDYRELLNILGISHLEHEMPTYLSGGQQQRVAIGRALMKKPGLLLWDEPFSALDHQIREELRKVVHRLKRRYNIPMIFVTHDLREAYELADQLAVMSDGKFLQVGSPRDIFEQPITRDVAQLVGFKNLLPYEVGNHSGSADEKTIIIDDITLRVKVDRELRTGGYVGIRPENILYVREEEGQSEPGSHSHVKSNIFEAVILSMRHQLDSYQLTIKVLHLLTPLEMSMPRAVIERYGMAEGDRIRVLLKYKSLVIMEGTA